MSLVIVWEHPDGTISYTIPCPNDQRQGETDDDFRARVAAVTKAAIASLATATRVADIDNTALPPVRFRDHWRFVGGTIRPNFNQSRQQVVAELRSQRDKIIADSDKLKAKYDDIGTAGEKTQVLTYRQQLRDLPTVVQADLAAMTTVAQLEAYVAPIPPLPVGISL